MKLFRDITQDLDLPSEDELKEATRVARIQQTRRARYKHNPEWRARADLHMQKCGERLAELNRKVDPSEYQDIILEYWSLEEMRPLHKADHMAEQRGLTSNFLQKIVNNYRDQYVDPEWFASVKAAYEQQFPEHKTMLHKAIWENKDNQAIGKKISETKNNLTAEQAREIYHTSMDHNNPDARNEATRKKLAKLYQVSANKIKKTQLGDHPALCDKDFESDYAAWKLATEGTYYFISPLGEQYDFADLKQVGRWLYKTEHGAEPESETRAWQIGRMWFEKVERGQEILKRRRFWKQWRYGRN